MHRLFFVRFHLDAKFIIWRVRFDKWIRFFRDLPIVPTQEMLPPREFDELLL